MITQRGVDAAVSLTEREAFQHNLGQESLVSAVVLATCDRVEVYEGGGLPSPEVVDHLFRVVSGLESPYLGEHQIQGQVKRAYQLACGAGPLDPGLHRLFQRALGVGKRIRCETALGRGALGHAQTVVALLKDLPVPLENLSLLVIGVNNLNHSILKFLVKAGHRTFFLGNRTLATAQTLVADLGAGTALPLDHLETVLGQVDVVISATSAPHLIVHSHHLPDAGGPRWFFDLASPRDIDPAVAHRPGVTLFNVEDLERAAAHTQNLRLAEVEAAEAIVRDETRRFFQVAGGAP